MIFVQTLIAVCLWSLVLLPIMGPSLSRAWQPAENFSLYQPPPWPQNHTDQEGKVQPVLVNGRFENFWSKDKANPLGFFLEWFTGNDESNIPSSSELDTTLPVTRPSWESVSNARMTWLGHASVLAEVDGAAILTDPIFSQRAAPFQFVGPKRYRPAACQVADLPPLSAVVISHTHYDHLDLNSVRDIAKQQPKCQFFVPKGLKSWMTSYTSAGEDRVHELSWWEERKLSEDITVAFTPSNHWCKRGAGDDNQVLWGSWTVVGPKTSFWFGGDTAYCEAFKQIGDKYGPFTMAAIPIGAYQPNWFMKFAHVHPGEAVEIHKDIRSNKSLGIHWGTFKLTTEFYLEPPRLLSQYLEQNNLTADEFVTVNIGESVQP